MFEAIVSGLLLASISGISFLAYKHPSGYRRLLNGLAPVIIGLAIGGMAAALQPSAKKFFERHDVYQIAGANA